MRIPFLSSKGVRSRQPAGDRRFSRILSAARLVQLCLAVITLILLVSYVAKLDAKPTRSNSLVLGIVSASILYGTVTIILGCCIAPVSWILTTITLFLDWAFAIGWVIVGILMKPTRTCGTRRDSPRLSKRQDVDDDDDDDEIDDDRENSTPSITSNIPAPTVQPPVAAPDAPAPQSTQAPTTIIDPAPSQIPTTLLQSFTTTANGQATTRRPTATNGGSLPTTSLPPGALRTSVPALGIQAGISSGDCNLAMGVFILAILSVLAFIVSIIIPCLFRRRLTSEKHQKLDEKSSAAKLAQPLQHVHPVHDEYMRGGIEGSTLGNTPAESVVSEYSNVRDAPMVRTEDRVRSWLEEEGHVNAGEPRRFV